MMSLYAHSTLLKSYSFAASAPADADERHNRKTFGVVGWYSPVRPGWPMVVLTHPISRQVMMIAIQGIRGMFRADTRSSEPGVAIHHGCSHAMSHRGESGEAKWLGVAHRTPEQPVLGVNLRGTVTARRLPGFYCVLFVCPVTLVTALNHGLRR